MATHYNEPDNMRAFDVAALSATSCFSPSLEFTRASMLFVAGWQVPNRRDNFHLPPIPCIQPHHRHLPIFPPSYQADLPFEWSKTYGESPDTVLTIVSEPLTIGSQHISSTSCSSTTRSSSSTTTNREQIDSQTQRQLNGHAGLPAHTNVSRAGPGL